MQPIAIFEPGAFSNIYSSQKSLKSFSQTNEELL
jgi:hypothetical protein